MKHNLRKSFFMILIALLFFLGVTSRSFPILAQDAAPSPTPTQQELDLQEQKRLIELQRDIELAKKAIRDAQPQPASKPTPPAPSATPLAGDTTLDSVKLEAEMVGYAAMSEAADHISKEIKGRKSSASNIAIYDSQVVQDWRLYRALFPAFEGQVEDIKNQYKSLLCTDPTISADVRPAFLSSIYCTVPHRNVKTAVGGFDAAFEAGSTLLKSFIDLTALFRTDTKIQGVAFTIDESALVAEVFRALKNDYSPATINLYYPKVFPPRVKNSSDTVAVVGDLFIYKKEADAVIKTKNADKDTTVGLMADPSSKKAKLEDTLAQIKGLNSKLDALSAALQLERKPAVRKKINEEITNAKVELAKLGETESSLNVKINAQKAILAPLEAKIKQINSDVMRLTDLNDRFLAFVNDFVKVDASGINALALFIKAEDIEHAMADPESYWLEIKSVSSGGNNRTRKNLLTFFTGAKLDHSGGVIIEYALYENSGAVVYSDKLSIYEGYVEPKKIRGAKVFKFEDKVK